MSLHHIRPVVETLDADRRARVVGRRQQVEADLDDVLRAASRGDSAAWSALVARFGPRLLSVVRSYRLGAHETEDVMQTAWLRLVEHIDRIREPAAVGAWLETTARRESIRMLAGGRRDLPADADWLDPEPVPAVAESNLVASETRAAITRALGDLPSRQRRLLALLFAEDEPAYERIASALNMPIGSIGPTRGRGLARLRRDAALLAALGD